MYRLTETHISAQFVQSQTFLNNTTPWVPFLQNQQPISMHSMNPLRLLFLLTQTTKNVFKANEIQRRVLHKTQITFQYCPHLGTHCIATRGNSQNRFQCLTCCKTQSCCIHCCFCWWTESQKLQCLFNSQNQLTQKNVK